VRPPVEPDASGHFDCMDVNTRAFAIVHMYGLTSQTDAARKIEEQVLIFSKTWYQGADVTTRRDPHRPPTHDGG
jgi:hypothetical protein